MVIFGVLTIVWGIVTLKGGLAGHDVDVGTYKGPRMASAGDAIVYGIGAILLGIGGLVVAYFWR
jgi:hypothetical protein